MAVSGKSGCGNTTVSKLLADTLHIKLVNYTFRNISAEQGISLAEIIEQAKNDDSFDIKVDTRQVELAREESCILGSRLAIWMLKDADFRVYLLADEDTRARRIQKREGGSLEKIRSFTAMRDKEDSLRYKRLYNIDNTDYSLANLVIDTKGMRPKKIVSSILNAIEKKGLIKKHRSI